ncbi:MAG: cupin domain-containing protein [Acidobacteria bacterium]|nr:cupin domain-containing protein [Acidobacteriota bacterium]MCI0722353.1 cupin domain-containing protein [Acidobacteriota bacterium]
MQSWGDSLRSERAGVRRWIASISCVAAVCGLGFLIQVKPLAWMQLSDKKTPRQVSATEGYVIARDAEVAQPGSGPHYGAGRSTGYVFFDKVPGFKLSFRKRVLHPGASIGYHRQESDEVYYISGGAGKMTINGHEFVVKAGDAILTRAGSSHGLAQAEANDLTLIIVCEK